MGGLSGQLQCIGAKTSECFQRLDSNSELMSMIAIIMSQLGIKFYKSAMLCHSSAISKIDSLQTFRFDKISP